MDVTFGTNAEKRPMFLVVAKMASGENMTVLSAFLPSEQKWVFRWLFGHALPYLLGPEALSYLRIVTMDEDERCLNAFLEYKNKYYPNADPRLCSWHKVGAIISYSFCISIF